MEAEGNPALEVGKGREMLFPLQQNAWVNPYEFSQLGKNQNLDQGRRAARTGGGILTPQLESGPRGEADLAEYPFSTLMRPRFRNEGEVQEGRMSQTVDVDQINQLIKKFLWKGGGVVGVIGRVRGGHHDLRMLQDK